MATWCRPARAGPRTPTAPRSSTAGCTAAAWRSRSPTSPPTPSRCWRCGPPPRPGRGSSGTVELHLTYDEEVGGEIGPRWLIEQGISKPDLALGAGFSYARGQRPQWLPASRGAGRRPLGARGHALDRRRRAGGRDPHPVRPLRLAEDAGRAPLGHRGHRQPAADDRADQGRHQHQRRARPGHLPARPAHGAGGVLRGGRGRARSR